MWICRFTSGCKKICVFIEKFNSNLNFLKVTFNEVCYLKQTVYLAANANLEN